MSCMLDCIHICIFHISKNCFEKLARHILDTLLSVELLKHFFVTQSRHLLNTWWIDRESSCLLDSSSTPARSIELLFSIPQLSKTRSSTPTSTTSSIPLDTCICQDLLAADIRPLCDLKFISLRSLSLDTSLFLS